MPRYEFRCADCETNFEERRPFARATEAAVCPTCAGERAERVIGVALFFSPGKAGAALAEQDAAPAPQRRHTSGCPCCG